MLHKWCHRHRRARLNRCKPIKSHNGGRGQTSKLSNGQFKITPPGVWLFLQNTITSLTKTLTTITRTVPISVPMFSHLTLRWPSNVIGHYKLWQTAVNPNLRAGQQVMLTFLFIGKSFKWYRRRGGLLLRFGHSHISYIKYPLQLKWRRPGRNRLFVISASRELQRWYMGETRLWRPSNVYHGRGLRCRDVRFLQKAGKVSAYR